MSLDPRIGNYLIAAGFFLLVALLLPDPWGWRLAIVLLLGYLAVNRGQVQKIANWLENH